MRRTVTTWIFAAAIPALLFSVAAEAGITCKHIPEMCPHRPHVSVPEPATLGLLAMGFAGAGAAAWRRRKRKD